MKLNQQAKVYVPFGGNEEEAFKKTTHLVVSAHQDDIEIMAQHGILTCFNQDDKHFAAVVCSDGAGSPRAGLYADYSNERMMQVREVEQKKAAVVGDYSCLFLLNYPSSAIKNGKERALIEDLKEILLELKPQVVYTHNPGDKHDTHVGTVLRVLTALQELAPQYKPEKVYGCEVWRALDWVNDDEKLALDVSGHPALRAALVGVFDSQVAGGKRYDLAALGRYSANATFFASHDTDEIDAASYALDLTPLVSGGDVIEFMEGYIDRFALDVKSKLTQFKSE